MEPASLLISVTATTLIIKKWLNDRQYKNEHIKALLGTIEQAHGVLIALAEGGQASKSLDTTIIAALQGIAESICAIKDHLSIWKEKRRSSALLAFINSGNVLDKLRNDEQLLSLRISTLSLALNVSSFVTSRENVATEANNILKFIRNPDVEKFWRRMIGCNKSCISGTELCRALEIWLQLDWTRSVQDTLILRLDEYEIGGITPTSLDDFVGEQTLERAVRDLTHGVDQEMHSDSDPPSYRSIYGEDNDANERWLVWIDDKHENNAQEISFAKSIGLTVYSFSSTSTVKFWLSFNEDKIRKLDKLDRIRFITNNTRWQQHERGGLARYPERTMLDLTAGDTILRYLRGRQYAAPVLVYCFSSLPQTQYVLSYRRAGSTASMPVCLSFINSFAIGLTTDTDWEGCGFSKQNPLSIKRGERASLASAQPFRLSRFADSSSIAVFCSVGSSDGILRSFYSGSEVTNRMAEVRKAITYIRTHWNEYQSFVRDLRLALDNVAENTAFLSDLIPSSKQWADRRSIALSEEDDYAILKLYTMDFGYRQIFRVINMAFRTDDLTENVRRLRSAVFFIELLNIDMFNYIYRANGSRNFAGTVYRGLCVNEAHVQEFRNLTEKPVRDRSWGIPLGMLSCSCNEDVAMKYAAIETNSNRDLHAIILRIRVFDLEPDLLAIYERRFPSSVVSTMCAVPIWDLSLYPDEEEVLLRGPFFQFVRMRSETSASGKLVHVVDAVMLNSNRDHPSTMELDEAEGAEARALFACLVTLSRAKVCKRLAEEFGHSQDAIEYDNVIREEKEKLHLLEGGLGP